MFSLSALWRNLFRRREFERNLSEELTAYADLLAEEKIARGMHPASARRSALLEIGGLEQVKEKVRDARFGNVFDSIWKDTAQSLRNLRKSPGSTALAIGTLALGLGAATLIFSVFYSVLLAPMPFRNPERLVQLWETRSGVEWQQASFNRMNFWDVRAQNRTFESVAALMSGDVNLTGIGNPEHLSAAYVSADFFRTLGVAPIRGHDFDRLAGQPGHDNAVVLLSEKFWRARFNSSPDVLRRTLRLNGAPYVVTGIVPQAEPWLNTADVFLPFLYDPKADRRGFEATVIGRLAPGVILATAQADLTRIAHQLSATYPADRGMGILISPSSTWGARPAVRRALWVLLAAVSLLLLIACVNIANLLLAKATARSRELRLREALGASRARIVRLVLTESLLLALAGSALGLLLAAWGLAAIRSIAISHIPRLGDTHLNAWVLAAALVLTIASAMGAGIAPALQSSSSNIAAVLREDDRAQTASRWQNRLRSLLVTAEVALAMMLLVGAALLLHSFSNLLNVNRGFATSKRVIAAINLPPGFDDARAARVTRALLERVRALPGVRAAAAVNSKPIVGWDPGMGFGAPDSARSASSEVPWASWRFVSTGYFRAMGIALLKGRAFSDDDFKYRDARRVVISASIADMLWPGQNPIGRRMSLWKGQSNRMAEVIGVVSNTRDHGLDADPTRIVYIPFIGQTSSPVQLIVHSSYAPGALANALRGILASIAPGIPVSEVQTLDELVAGSLGSQRLNTDLLSAFALLALLLTLSGIYGVLSYTIARRTQEIGIRVALGASRRSILALVFAQGMRPVVAGIVLGIAGSLTVARLLSSLLFQVQPVDLPSYLGVLLLIVIAASIACFLPARRALRVDPLAALRTE